MNRIQSIYIFREVTQYKLSNFELGLKIYVASSSLFSFTGISFRLSRKILDSAKKRIQKDQVKTYIIFDFMETIHNYLIGHWTEIGNYDPELVNRNLEDGELYLSSQHLYWHGCPSIYMGDLDQAHGILEKLTHIAEVYENDFSILLNYMLKIKLLMEQRYLDDALAEIEKGIVFAKNKGFTITLLDFGSCRAMIYTLLQDADQAARSIQLADEIRSAVRATPGQLSIFYRSQLVVSLFQLEEALKAGDTAGAAGHITIAGKACKMIMKTTRKAAQHRTEALKLKGVYYWLMNKPKFACRWMKKAVAEGEKLGARPELARTCFEIGKRLMEPGNRVNSLNGFTAREYLDRAKSLFEEMGLEWDLEKLKQLDRQL